MVYYEGVDYFIYYLEFPHMGVPGAIAANSDGTSNIYINTLYCEEIQQDTLKHELRHMVKEHLYNDRMALWEKELEADDIFCPDCIFAEDHSYVVYLKEKEAV